VCFSRYHVNRPYFVSFYRQKTSWLGCSTPRKALQVLKHVRRKDSRPRLLRPGWSFIRVQPISGHLLPRNWLSYQVISYHFPERTIFPFSGKQHNKAVSIEAMRLLILFFFMERGPWVPTEGCNPCTKIIKFDKNAQAVYMNSERIVQVDTYQDWFLNRLR